MRRRFPVPPTKSLTDQQKYLLQRIPGKYDIAEPKPEREPAEVRAARKLANDWDEAQRKASCKAKCQGEKAIQRAKEAVYFQPIESALKAVQEVESLTKCCES